jgi:hypothetical protein
MSKLKWLRTYLLTPILVPLRFILLILVVWIAWFVSFISLVGLSEDQILNHPMTGWRQTSKQISSFFGRLAFRVTGFMDVTIMECNLQIRTTNVGYRFPQQTTKFTLVSQKTLKHQTKQSKRPKSTK